MMEMMAEPALSAGGFAAHRPLGMSPGDYIDVLQREFDRYLKQARGNRLQAVKLALRQMRSSGLITERDLKRMNQVCVIVFSAERAKQPAADTVAKLERLHHEALGDPEASTMGTTMVGVAYSTRNRQVIAAGGLGGMVIGAMLTGSPWGALVGGLVGGWLAGRCGKD